MAGSIRVLSSWKHLVVSITVGKPVIATLRQNQVRNFYGTLRLGRNTKLCSSDTNFLLRVTRTAEFNPSRVLLWRSFISGRPMLSTNQLNVRRRHRTVMTYVCALAVCTVGLSYAAVPLYRMYCQAAGLGGTVTQLVDVGDQIETMERKSERLLTIKFNADTSNTLQWRFKPQQSEIKLVPGETALAFYKAENLTDHAVTGVSTYNVVPFEAGQYFNKIQCFCFEEQRLNPREEVDMPVFFYIDPEMTEDPALAKVDIITLSYTFFEAKEGQAATLGQIQAFPASQVQH